MGEEIMQMEKPVEAAPNMPEEKKEEKKQSKKPVQAKQKTARKAKEKKPQKKAGSAPVTGKRKTAIARASIKPGKGMVKINSVPIELVQPEMARLRMQEPLILMGDEWKRFDIRVNVRGGGITSQADAARQAIAKGLAEMLGEEARKTFLSYDRNLLVYDPRRAETHKPPHSSWGARRYKQRSKR